MAASAKARRLSGASSARSLRGRAVSFHEGDSRFELRLAEVLGHATSVFCTKGYAAASMRDLSRASGMSLAGLYHYSESKEKLLYLIQKHTFSTVLSGLRERLKGVDDPAERIRIFVRNHLDYFLQNQQAMKVVSHEADSLTGEFAREIASLKRDYYRICVGLLEDLKRGKGVELCAPTRIAVLSLFGMVNWIYTWHHPRTDADAASLAREMSDIFLEGVCLPAGTKRRKSNFRQGAE